MMNLRELIFSQQSQESAIEDNHDSDGSEDQDDDRAGTNVGQRNWKYRKGLVIDAMRSSKGTKRLKYQSEVYTTHPENVFQESLFVKKGLKPEKDQAYHPEALQFAPGMSSYLRFNQAEGPELVIKKRILRAVFNECFYGRDYPGAYMAMQTLTEVDIIGRPELERFIHMLRHTSDGLTPQWVEMLLKSVSDATSMKRNVSLKSSLLQTFIELAVADGDLLLAQVDIPKPDFTLLYCTLLLPQLIHFNHHSFFTSYLRRRYVLASPILPTFKIPC